MHHPEHGGTVHHPEHDRIEAHALVDRSLSQADVLAVDRRDRGVHSLNLYELVSVPKKLLPRRAEGGARIDNSLPHLETLDEIGGDAAPNPHVLILPQKLERLLILADEQADARERDRDRLIERRHGRHLISV